VTLTLLLDLDDTLLLNPMQTFLPAYLQQLSTHLARFAPPTQMVQALLAGTEEMMQNQRPDRTLKQVFEAVFYPALGLRPRALRASIEQFYAEIFPTLQPLTRPQPAAVQLVESALERGYRLAIATNPLFPLTAITQRLEWAGLSPQKYPFSLIPSYETFHFTKPNPAFFAELLAYLDWPEGPLVMVGDDVERDIRSAQAMGLATYWVHNEQPTSVSSDAAPAGGPLEDLLSWLDALPASSLQPHYNHPTALKAILRATPAAIHTLSRSLARPAWSARPQPNEWSLTEIVCHLRDVEIEVNLPRLERILQEPYPFLPGVDSDRWAEERQYQQQDGRRALQRFSRARQRSLQLLERLSPADWQRNVRHAIFGPTQVLELVSFMAGHDQMHMHQVHQALIARAHNTPQRFD
jgi:FMN phosphatase YigB (HAD superfamily)